MSKNCLKCIHFARKVIYEYTPKGYVSNITSTFHCDKLKLNIPQKLSEEKRNEEFYIPSRCHQGEFFRPISENKVVLSTVWKEV